MDEKILHELKLALEQEDKELIDELKLIATPDAHRRGEWQAAFPQFEEERSGSSSSEEENADEVEEYETRIGTSETLETRLHEVEAALTRMKDGTYGICPTCSKPITPERLHANPAALYDVEHEPK